jgi:hypothetical protein
MWTCGSCGERAHGGRGDLQRECEVTATARELASGVETIADVPRLEGRSRCVARDESLDRDADRVDVGRLTHPAKRRTAVWTRPWIRQSRQWSVRPPASLAAIPQQNVMPGTDAHGLDRPRESVVRDVSVRLKTARTPRAPRPERLAALKCSAEPQQRCLYQSRLPDEASDLLED